MAPEFSNIIMLVYVMLIINIVQVVQVHGRFTGYSTYRYRYETPTIRFSASTIAIPAPRAQLNIPTRPILQDVETPPVTSLPISPTSSKKKTSNIAVSLFPLDGCKDFSPNCAQYTLQCDTNTLVKERCRKTCGLCGRTRGHAAVSPYFADPDSDLRAPSPPDTKASDLTDDIIDVCPVNISDCDPSYPWRKIGGHCNNLANPHFGAAFQPMPRLLGAKFDIGMVRTFGEDGSLLPNPRSISLTLNLPPRRSTNHNLLIMQIGQFVDHDQIHMSVVKGPDGTDADCKSCESWTNPVCMPIPISSADPFFPSHSVDGERNCLPFTRNVVSEGKFNTVDPLNFNTAFLDLSTVYASDHCQSKELRLYQHGLMRMDHLNDVPKGLPPSGLRGFEECRLETKKCFHTGDVRGNEHMTLLIMHNIFLREHNRVADELYNINIHWDDERIFQEARRINIAQYQHVVYQEYLPALIGFSKARDYGLQALAHDYFKDYSEEINPGIVNEFAGAAYRIGHSMIPEFFPKYNKDFQYAGELALKETFHNPQDFGNPKQFDDLIRGLLATRLPAIDSHFEEVIKRHLFELKNKPFSGEDLIARNIARGREFGYPGYIDYVKVCGVSSEIKTWSDLYTLMDPVMVQYLQKIYKHPKDIDLFVGGVSEIQSPEALVGPTFSCIIANQFIMAKRGDRFWYENEANGLTLRQLDSIRKTSRWSRILCKNLNEYSALQYYSTSIPIKSLNPLVRCEQLEDLDLSQWREPHEKHYDSCNFRGNIYQIMEQLPLTACSSCFCNTNGEVKCVAANVNCQSLSESEHREESCQLLCGPRISSTALEQAEDVDRSYLEKLYFI